MEALTPEQALPYIDSWVGASDHEKISLYKQQAKEAVRQLYLRSLPYYTFSGWGLKSGLVRFFELHDHDSPCRYCKHTGKCIAGPWQLDAFRVIGMDRAAILANDEDLYNREGWVRLITSLKDEDIRAKVIIEIRNEHIRKKLLGEMEADMREEILERISQIQSKGYTTLDGSSWFCVATRTFNSVCGVCQKDYDTGATILNKTCGVHTSHMKCAEEKWGRRRIDWLANPCQLCKGC